MKKARINIKDITIEDNYKNPGIKKLTKRLEYFEKYGKFLVPIVLDADNKLIDGYTSYLVAIKQDIDVVDVVYVEGNKK